MDIVEGAMSESVGAVCSKIGQEVCNFIAFPLYVLEGDRPVLHEPST